MSQSPAHTLELFSHPTRQHRRPTSRHQQSRSGGNTAVNLGAKFVSNSYGGPKNGLENKLRHFLLQTIPTDQRRRLSNLRRQRLAVYGGTSAAAPIIVAVYALATTPERPNSPTAKLYAHPGARKRLHHRQQRQLHPRVANDVQQPGNLLGTL